MVVHTFNPSTLQRQTDLNEFKASLRYRVSVRTANATQRNHISKKQNKTIKQPKTKTRQNYGAIEF